MRGDELNLGGVRRFQNDTEECQWGANEECLLADVFWLTVGRAEFPKEQTCQTHAQPENAGHYAPAPSCRRVTVNFECYPLDIGKNEGLASPLGERNVLDEVLLVATEPLVAGGGHMPA